MAGTRQALLKRFRQAASVGRESRSRKYSIIWTIAAVRLGGTRCRARHASIFSTSCGSARMAIFALLGRIRQRVGHCNLASLIIPAKNLIIRPNRSPERRARARELTDQEVRDDAGRFRACRGDIANQRLNA